MALNLNGYDALKKVDAKSESANEDNRGVGGDESVSELLSRDIFSEYRSRSVSRGRTHPGSIAEAASLRYLQTDYLPPAYIAANANLSAHAAEPC